MMPNYQYLSRAASADEPVTIYATGIATAPEVSVVADRIEITPQSTVAIPDAAGMYQISVNVPSNGEGRNMSISSKTKMPDGSTVMSNDVCGLRLKPDNSSRFRSVGAKSS
jgi:hypothetical protein